MRATENAGVEHAGQADIGAVSGFAGDALAGVDAGSFVADGSKRGERSAFGGEALDGQWRCDAGGGESGFDVAIVIRAAADVAGERGAGLFGGWVSVAV